ncbi:hypothetical protein GGI42DRAFT_188256 [Trichoderma sp. SZMC 28013]
MDRSSRVEKPSLAAAMIVYHPLIPEIGFPNLKWTMAVSPCCGTPLATATGQHDSSSRVQTHRFHWPHHCNKLMVAPSSAADSIKTQPGSVGPSPRLALSRNRNGIPCTCKGERARVGAKRWAARGPSSSSCKIISAYEIPTQGCTSTS